MHGRAPSVATPPGELGAEMGCNLVFILRAVRYDLPLFCAVVLR